MDNKDIPVTLELGGPVNVTMIDDTIKEHYLEDGPYFPKNGIPWIAVSNDEGEIISAEWNQEKLNWIELR